MRTRNNDNERRKERSKKSKEEYLKSRDECGIKDPTPQRAVKNIIQQEQAS